MQTSKENHRHVIVIGGGAAGMMAAYKAAEDGCQVTLLEKNEKLGKKIFITGKGRCNVTNACETEDLFQSIVTNPKFLYSSIYTFTNSQVMDFFRDYGCPLKIERGNRVFPVSDKSSDVIKALEKALRQKGVRILLNSCCSKLLIQEGTCNGVILVGGENLPADAVIIATGGCSYPSTGSTGDGYRFGKKTGHHLKEPKPSLVPLVTKSSEPKEMMGLSLKNVEVSFYTKERPGKILYREFGEMLFTHFGLSGPLILSASSYLQNIWGKGRVICSIDLKPALSGEQLDERILRDFSENKNCFFKNSLDKLLPKKMIPIILKRTGIEPERPVNSITRKEREFLKNLIKNFELECDGTRDFNEAIITHGGISVSDINPSTMESKIVSDLYFAGEVLDLDAVTGGYNLQIAWSTGYLAGMSAAQ